MSPRHQPPTPRPFPTLVVHVTTGSPRPRWCAVCKAWTAFSGDALLLSPEGVSVVGSYIGCEVCDDPDQEERTRRV